MLEPRITGRACGLSTERGGARARLKTGLQRAWGQPPAGPLGPGSGPPRGQTRPMTAIFLRSPRVATGVVGFAGRSGPFSHALMAAL